VDSFLSLQEQIKNLIFLLISLLSLYA